MNEDPRPVTFDTYTPNWRQREFHDVKLWTGLTKLFKGAIGGLSAGKTAACEREQVDICRLTPGGNSVALRGSMPNAERSLLEDYRKFLFGVAKWNDRLKAFVFPNGHKLFIMPADDAERLGSTQYVTAYFQEAQEIAWKVVSTALERVRNPAGILDGFPYFRVLFDARGVPSNHWIATEFVKRAWRLPRPDDTEPPTDRARAHNPHWIYAQFRTGDNLQHSAPGYEATLRYEHRDDPSWIKTYIEGELGHDVGGIPVFGDSYHPEHHEADEIEPDPALPLLRGWDFGYNTPAVTWCQYSKTGRFTVLRELCPTKCSRTRLVQEAKALQQGEFPGWYEGNFRDFGDIAGIQHDKEGITDIEIVEEQMETSFEGLQRADIPSGLSVMRGLMQAPWSKLNGVPTPQFVVDRRCVTVCEALRGMYCYDEKHPTRQPKKGNGYDNPIDTIRYICQTVVAERDYEADGTGTTGSEWVSSFWSNGRSN